jgi:hypothetical protein
MGNVSQRVHEPFAINGGLKHPTVCSRSIEPVRPGSTGVRSTSDSGVTLSHKQPPLGANALNRYAIAARCGSS